MDESTPIRAATAPALVRMRRDGPNVFEGDFVIKAAIAPDSRNEPRAFLCRCGASGSKPYCDGTHKKIGFRHDGTFAAHVLPGTTVSGQVTITPLPNGPLECMGPLTVEASDGRRATSVETWLCRCGGSKSKPYCDGTHEKNGFTG
jgi:CDGSH-type Zn-finger protein